MSASQVTDHNAIYWLQVRELPAAHGGPSVLLGAGWYVVRVCPCHYLERVTLPFDEPEQAEHARRVMLEVASS